ncbi:carboxylating nicotinate-nucleotide diphosphorylase [Candidatus Thorarchaeota archaeon]|nr:MAG: carboxylating nicotinate-nucleotide diphosphorylase [Candidatus Thorarchaeota archaeon]
MKEPPAKIVEKLQEFLDEDIRSGDITTNAMGVLSPEASATIFAKSRAVLAGMEEAAAIAKLTDLEYELLESEGDWVSPGDPVMKFKGKARTLLMVERICLNIIQRMSGIATKTNRMVTAARDENPDVIVAATRKTTPGFRYFEKRAVTLGGGDPHRYALDDMVLIKNNHITAIGGVTKAIEAAKQYVSFSKKISCEARNLDEALEAAHAGADIILLDNFSPEDVAKAHSTLKKEKLRSRVLLETSGGINESNVKEYAKTDIDIISSGSLTHSYDASDFNMILSLD